MESKTNVSWRSPLNTFEIVCSKSKLMWLWHFLVHTLEMDIVRRGRLFCLDVHCLKKYSKSMCKRLTQTLIPSPNESPLCPSDIWAQFPQDIPVVPTQLLTSFLLSSLPQCGWSPSLDSALWERRFRADLQNCDDKVLPLHFHHSLISPESSLVTPKG